MQFLVWMVIYPPIHGTNLWGSGITRGLLFSVLSFEFLTLIMHCQEEKDTLIIEKKCVLSFLVLKWSRKHLNGALLSIVTHTPRQANITKTWHLGRTLWKERGVLLSLELLSYNGLQNSMMASPLTQSRIPHL